MNNPLTQAMSTRLSGSLAGALNSFMRLLINTAESLPRINYPPQPKPHGGGSNLDRAAPFLPPIKESNSFLASLNMIDEAIPD